MRAMLNIVYKMQPELSLKDRFNYDYIQKNLPTVDLIVTIDVDQGIYTLFSYNTDYHHIAVDIEDSIRYSGVASQDLYEEFLVDEFVNSIDNIYKQDAISLLNMSPKDTKKDIYEQWKHMNS